MRERPASDADWPAAWALQRAAFLDEVTREAGGWTPELEAACRHAWRPELTTLVEDGARLVAWHRVEQRAHDDWLDLLVVAPDVQGRGLGSRLLSGLVGSARRRGVPLWLSVHTENPARAFYERRGFDGMPRDAVRTLMVSAGPIGEAERLELAAPPAPDGDELALFRAADVAFNIYNARRALEERPAELEVRPLPGLACFRDRARDAGYYNRVLVTGAGEGLDEAVAWVDEVRPAVVNTTSLPEHAAVRAELSQRGFTLDDSSLFFARPPAPSSEPGVRPPRPDELLTVLRLWSRQPDVLSPEALARVVPEQLAPGFELFVREDGGVPVAMASSYVHGPVAILANANTHPDARGRGHQAALLRARLDAASRARCTLAVADTARRTSSHRNVLRAGFRPWFVELTWRRAVE